MHVLDIPAIIVTLIATAMFLGAVSGHYLRKRDAAEARRL